MKYSNSIEYNISTKLDKSGITQLQAQIKQLENSMQQMSNRELIDSEKVQTARAQLQGLNTALTNSFNPSLGILDFTKFRAELDKNNVSALQLKSIFNTMGVEGQKTLKGLTTQIANFNGGMERTSSTVDKMFVTFSNTFRWGLISSFFSQFMNAIHSSVQYAKDLDDSLTQIMLVTDYSRDSMNEYARAANEAAKAVGQTTVGMTNASLIFAQQGYDLNQSQQLATLSAKLANASQQDTAATSDQITAYMNAYGLQNSMDELVQAMDNWAKIANISAADVEEIALASQRAASMANAVGVSGEALAAQIATIESVTREAPEQIGNGLKTLYARFSDLKLGKDDEDGVGLGKVTSTLQQIGVQVLDAFGNVRDMDDIMEDLMVVWEDLDDTSKTAAAQALAGKHQVNRFMALMENADMYQEYKGATGVSASGTLEQMNAEYLDSLQGRMTKLQASLEGLFSSIFNTDDIYPWIDKAQDAVDLLQKFFDALGGGKTILLGIATLFGKLFNQNIAHSINSMMENAALGQTRKNNVESINQTLDRAGIDSSQGVGAYIRETADQAKLGALSNDQYRTYLDNVQNWTNNSIALAEAEQQLTDTINIANAVFKKVAGDAPFKQETDEAGTTTVTGGFDAKEVDIKERKEAIQNIDFTEEIQQTKKVTLELNNLHESMESLGKDGTTSIQDIKNKIAQLIQSLNGLDNVYDLDKVEDLENALSDLKNDLEKTSTASEESKKKIADYGREIGELNKRLHEMDSSAAERVINDSGREAEQQAIELNFRRIAEQNAKQKAMDDQASINRQQAVKGILDVVNAVQQLTFSYQAFKNIGSIWANEDLTKGEKVLQTIMNLTMALPQLINAMKVFQSTNLMGNIAQISKFAKTLQELGIPGSKKFVDSLKNIGSESENTEKLLAGLSPTIGKAMATAAAEGATGIGVLKAGFKALAAEIAPVLAELLPFIAAAAAIGAIVALFQYQMEQVKKARQEALDALEEVKSAQKEMQSIREQAIDLQNRINSAIDSNNGFEDLVESARDLADAFIEIGETSKSAEIRIAATRAEALGTTEAYEELAQTVERVSLQAEMDANTEVQEASIEVIKTQQANVDDLIAKQSRLRDIKEELNNLDADDPRRSRLEEERAELEEYIQENWEAVDAVNALREAQASNVGLQLSQNEVDLVHSSRINDAAGPSFDHAGTYDYSTIDEFYRQNVDNWDSYSELEKIDIMLNTLQDDAQIAAVQIEELLYHNASLKDMGYAGQGITAEEQRNNITAALENSGLSAEQSLQLMATFDEDATYAEIMRGIREVSAAVANGEDFDIVLRARMSPEQVKDAVKNAINAYEPTDEDVNIDEFRSMANYIQGADDSAFEEGGMFEDIAPTIREDAEAIEDLVEGILRYDNAVSTLQDKEDEWRDGLSDTADFQDRANAVEELKETYSDFLNLGDDVSDQFAENAHNLDLMARAAEGDLEAYNELLAAAATDIAINVYGVDESSAALADLSAYLQSDAFSDIEVGMNIEDEAFYDALNRLAAEAGWTADDLNAYLNSIDCSIDPSGFEETANNLLAAADETGAAEAEALNVRTTTTIESGTGQETNTTEYTNATANVTAETGYTTLPVAGGDSGPIGAGYTPTTARIPYSIPSVSYTVTPVSKTDIAEKTGFAVNQDAKQGSGGKGGVQVKPGSVRKTGSGGSKNRGSSAPRSSGGGKGGGGCFVAGTLVSLQNQFKNIEDIQIGDIVLSYNEEIHQNEYSIVLQTMIHDVTEEIYDLYIENEILTVTGIHRFYIRRKHDIEWIPASDLHIGDYVLFADGNWYPIFKIKVRIRSLLVYNFEVSHNHNYYVGRNQILAHNKGGKGGGGGGSAKTIQPKEKKEHKKDYYERVNSQLDKLKEQLSGIEKQEDRLIGSKARANQQKQIKLIEREIELEKERLEILQSAKENELADVKALMEAKEEAAEEILEAQKIAVTDLPSPKEDAEGIITNYEEISRAIDERHNDLIDKYNDAAKAGNEELTKTIDEAIKKFDEYSAAILENAKRQNAIQKEIESTKNTIQELSDSIEDINIEIYKVSLEAIENLKDLNEVHAEFAGFLSGFKSDSPLRALIEDLDELNNSYAVSKDRVQEFYSALIAEKEKAKESADDDEKAVIDKEIEYFQKKINEAAAGTETELWANGEVGYYLEALRELRKWMNGEEDENSPNIFGNNTKALYETYLDVYKKTKESALNYEKMVEDTVGDIIDIYDEVADKQEEYLKGYEHWVEKFEKFKDMYTLTYGEESYAAISALEKKQGEILQAQTQQQQEIYNYWAAQYAEAIKEGSGVSQEVKDAIKEHMQEAEEALWDLGQEAGEIFVQAYEDAVKGAVQKLNSQVLPEGDSDFNRIDREWEWAKEFVDNYKDEVEKTFEVEKLRNKYADLLNEAQGSSLATQNKIRKQMEEQLKLLENEEHMSQFDIDLANSKLLILQKQIALEDAQRNKNQMQLRRDSQGNYRYVYRASQNDIAKARQEYLEAIEEGYELSKRHATDTAEKLEATLKKFGEDWENLNTNMNISDEERQKQSIKLMDDFIEYMDYLAEDFNEGQDGLTNILNEMVMNSTESTAKAAQLMLSNLFDNTSNLLDAEDRAWWDYANALSEIFSKINKDNRTLVEELASTTNGEMDDLRKNLTGDNGVLSVIGKEINSEDGYNSAVQDATAAIKDLNIQTQDLLTEGLQPFNDAITKNINDIISWESTLANARTTLKELEEDYKRISQIMGEDAAAKNTINIPETPPSTTTTSSNNTTTTTTAAKPAATKKTFSNGSIAGYKGSYYGTSWGGGGSGNSLSGQANKIKISSFSRGSGYGPYNIHIETLNGGYLGWIKEDQLFDTGGYTGEWGKDGRLAVLHQKELVLNAEDTRNILSAVDIVRQMTSTLGNALTNYSVGSAKQSFLTSALGGIDQRVEIKAEFPNVRDAFEIETALTNLADKAYQYAHRKI